VKTPHLNAAVEGTEFLVALNSTNHPIGVRGKVSVEQRIAQASRVVLESGRPPR
jgi:ferric-dicitrate binding protein FerR (iron transport regulator)